VKNKKSFKTKKFKFLCVHHTAQWIWRSSHSVRIISCVEIVLSSAGGFPALDFVPRPKNGAPKQRKSHGNPPKPKRAHHVLN
jgi:hypothetical protein